jgi:hypothetical protein
VAPTLTSEEHMWQRILPEMLLGFLVLLGRVQQIVGNYSISLELLIRM